jgi:hypothetical protein
MFRSMPGFGEVSRASSVLRKSFPDLSGLHDRCSWCRPISHRSGPPPATSRMADERQVWLCLRRPAWCRSRKNIIVIWSLVPSKSRREGSSGQIQEALEKRLGDGS